MDQACKKLLEIHVEWAPAISSRWISGSNIPLAGSQSCRLPTLLPKAGAIARTLRDPPTQKMKHAGPSMYLDGPRHGFQSLQFSCARRVVPAGRGHTYLLRSLVAPSRHLHRFPCLRTYTNMMHRGARPRRANGDTVTQTAALAMT